jgi:hypothetical protein
LWPSERRGRWRVRMVGEIVADRALRSFRPECLEVRDGRGEWQPSAESAWARPRRQTGWADGVGAGAAAHRRMVEGAASVPTAASHPAAALQVIFLWLSGVCDEESRRLAAWGEGEDEAASPRAGQGASPGALRVFNAGSSLRASRTCQACGPGGPGSVPTAWLSLSAVVVVPRAAVTPRRSSRPQRPQRRQRR